jgi:hypothetical protein
MNSDSDVSALYRDFTDALTEVLAENAVGPARRGRLARARAAVKKHPEYNEHAYFLAVETAFTQWEALQNVGR